MMFASGVVKVNKYYIFSLIIFPYYSWQVDVMPGGAWQPCPPTTSPSVCPHLRPGGLPICSRTGYINSVFSPPSSLRFPSHSSSLLPQLHSENSPSSVKSSWWLWLCWVVTITSSTSSSLDSVSPLLMTLGSHPLPPRCPPAILPSPVVGASSILGPALAWAGSLVNVSIFISILTSVLTHLLHSLWKILTTSSGTLWQLELVWVCQEWFGLEWYHWGPLVLTSGTWWPQQSTQSWQCPCSPCPCHPTLASWTEGPMISFHLRSNCGTEDCHIWNFITAMDCSGNILYWSLNRIYPVFCIYQENDRNRR